VQRKFVGQLEWRVCNQGVAWPLVGRQKITSCHAKTTVNQIR
jgi:hypothetical protein